MNSWTFQNTMHEMAWSRFVCCFNYLKCIPDLNGSQIFDILQWLSHRSRTANDGHPMTIIWKSGPSSGLQEHRSSVYPEVGRCSPELCTTDRTTTFRTLQNGQSTYRHWHRLQFKFHQNTVNDKGRCCFCWICSCVYFDESIAKSHLVNFKYWHEVCQNLFQCCLQIIKSKARDLFEIPQAS